ncbi:MAG: beta-ketoacyl-ACP synthase II [Gemmatimonadota bacterium]|jgi:3-oxoacyl-[acyl-carrier-protein] synthase II
MTGGEGGAGRPSGGGDGTRRRVVVTGIGPITASGIGRDALWEGLHREHSPVGRVTRFDASPFRTWIAAEVRGFEPTDYMERQQARRMDRFAQFSIAATRVAVEDAGLDTASVDPGRVAIQMGSALGGLAHAQDELINYLERGVRGVDPRVATTVFCGAASCQIAIEFGFTGPNSTNAMSCASGTIAVGEGWRLIRDGTVDVALTGGIEAPLAPLSYGAFAIIRAMSTRNDDPERACRPFDRGRDGFVMGEGACVLVLEELERAVARRAPIYAEVLGYGLTNDAHHMTAPRPDAAQASTAMRTALRTAGLEPTEVDHVNAHGSSTPLNDSTETLAIKTVLGEHAYEIPVSGTKPYYGHALGASGAIEIGIGCLTLARGWLPPTLNLEYPGEGCDLDYVPNHGRGRRVRTLLSNSFGFGGINACVALRGWNGRDDA